MPMYEYKCNSCGHSFERLCPISKRDDPGACPKCGSEDVVRGLSRVAKAQGCDNCSSGSCSCGGCSTGNCSTCG
ncbi:MAG: FmdB family zinc ribbon protein [bacterium]